MTTDHSDPHGSSEAPESRSGQAPISSPTSPQNRPRGSRFPPAARWTVVFFVVVIALVVAIWPREDGSSSSSSQQVRPSGALSATDLQVDDAQLAQARTDAAIAPCPQVGGPAPGPSAVLAGVSVPCLATGAPYDVGTGTVGKPLVINMWAVWCEPCRRELPVLAEYAQRAGEKVTVLTVHAKEGAGNQYLVLRFLTELGVHLPVVLDTDGAVAAALRAPRVFPSTIIVRADGSVAKIAPTVFDDPQQIADEVRSATGVTT